MLLKWCRKAEKEIRFQLQVQIFICTFRQVGQAVEYHSCWWFGGKFLELFILLNQQWLAIVVLKPIQQISEGKEKEEKKMGHLIDDDKCQFLLC